MVNSRHTTKNIPVARTIADLTSDAWHIVAKRVEQRPHDAWAWTVPTLQRGPLHAMIEAGACISTVARSDDGALRLMARLNASMEQRA